MRVIEPGHIYELDHIDGPNKQRITFVNREEHPHEGTQTQEVLRMTVDVMESLIDRANHCDACKRWEGNDRIIKALSEAQRQMRLAILIHEERALERKLDKGTLVVEQLVLGDDGHLKTQHYEGPAALKPNEIHQALWPLVCDVCGAQIRFRTHSWQTYFLGIGYYMCSRECSHRFDANPVKYERRKSKIAP